MSLSKNLYYLKSVFTILNSYKDPLKVASYFLRNRGGVVTFKRTMLEFGFRGRMDIWCLKETIADRFYERYGFPVQPGWVVVDIGAGIGDYSILAAKTAGTQVFAYEPYAPSFNLLRENIVRNNRQNVIAYQEAVSSQKGSLRLKRVPDDPLSTQTSLGDADLSGMTVPSITFSSMIARLPSDRVDLLKLDCEGAEYDILMDSPASSLEFVDRIVMEYHDGIVQRSHEDLISYLEQNQFTVEHWPNLVHNEIGYLRAVRQA